MGSVDVSQGALTPSDRWKPGSAPAEREDFIAPDIEGDEPAIDLRAVWATIFRNRYMMIAIVGVALMLGIASALLMPRKYTAQSSIQIDQQVAKVLGTEDSEPQIAGSDADRFLQTQADVLNSRAIARRVSDSLALSANDDFLKRMTGARQIEIKPGDASLADQVVDVLQRNLAIDLRRNSRVVRIIFTSRDPALAAEIANSYATNFIEGNIQRKFSASA
jgi:succinoglycan biosynthesis transport protein ExoP